MYDENFFTRNIWKYAVTCTRSQLQSQKIISKKFEMGIEICITLCYYVYNITEEATT